MNKKIFVKVISAAIITLIISIITELIFPTNKNYIIDTIIIKTLCITFVELHFLIELTDLYDFIIKHRFKIAIIGILFLTVMQYSYSSNGIYTKIILENDKNSTLFGSNRSIKSDEYAVETLLAIAQRKNNFNYYNSNLRGIPTDMFSLVHPPVKDILTIGKIYNIGYMFLNDGMGLAFSSSLRYFLLLLASYELFYIITNKQKYLSLVSTIILMYSGATQWLFLVSNSLIDIIISGELALVLLNVYLKNSDNLKIKSLSCLGISLCAISFIFTFYPAFMIPFAYIFIALAIWIILENKASFKFKKIDLLLLSLGATFIFLLCFRYFNLSKNTLYDLANTSYPGNRINTGGHGLKYLFSYLINPFMPFIDFGDNFSLASYFSLFPIPLILAIYFIVKKKNLSFLLPITCFTILETFFAIIGFPKIISKLTLFSLSLPERTAVAINLANFYILIYILSHFETKLLKKQNKLIIVTTLLFINLITGLLVNPITKSTYAITETDLAHKIQEIIKDDSDANWISVNDTIVLSNYVFANGAKILNSTNIYPNKEFFETILGKELAIKQENIWNRYCHIQICLDSQNYVELLDKDKVQLHISPEKLKELNIKYIISYNSLEENLSQHFNFTKEYEKLYISNTSKHNLREKLNTQENIINGVDVQSINIYKVEY